MRWLSTVLIALVTSVLVGSVLATAAGLFVFNDDSFVVLVMTVLVTAVAAAVPLAIALVVPRRKGAVRFVAYALLVVLALMAFGVSAVEFGAQGSLNAASRAMEMAGLMFCSGAVVVLVQWLVFGRAANAQKPLPEIRFGRQGARPNA